MAHPALIALGKIAAPLIMKKVTKEIERKFDDVPKVGPNDDGEIIELADTVEAYVVDKKKAGGWSAIAIALAYFGASQGWFGPEVAQLIDTLLSNPEVVEAIEGVVEQ